MDILEQFEYSLPELWCDKKEIRESAQTNLEGSLTVKNTGSGMLTGALSCSSRFIKFTPTRFKSNFITIGYKADLSSFRPSESIKAQAVLVTNGGELEIPINITAEPPCIVTDDGAKIANSSDFASYARESPLKAVEYFRKSEFRQILERTSPELVSIYDHISSDSNKERSMESFLRLIAAKKPAKVVVMRKRIQFWVKPFETELQTGVIPIKKEGWGFIEDNVYIEGGAMWLKVPLTLAQALEKQGLPFYIEPVLLPKKFNSAKIRLAGNPESHCEISATKLPFFKASLSREILGPEEDGAIIVDNYTGSDLLAEVVPADSFIRLDAKRYHVKERAEIPFKVRLTALQSLSVRKQLTLDTSITVRAAVRDSHFSVKLKLSVGEWR
ncbi:MAG: DUF5717 family protein [Clostridiales bacterium]|jgi:hypothetical protein|nr:DUF5717 family protein [Clostridiales bacterium]